MSLLTMNGSSINNGGNAAVIDVLRNASSQQPHLIKAAEQQLEQWERLPGFYHTLLQVYADLTLDTNVRWMAVLCFKNGVDKFWRVMGEHKLSDEEKSSIRSLLVSLVVCQQAPAEHLPQLSLQVAVCTGKVARQDCPHAWPELLPALMSSVTGSPGVGSEQELVVRQRALLTTHHVIKQVSSRRLLHDRRKFQELAIKLFPDLHQLFKSEVQLFLSTNQSCGDLHTIGSALQRSHYCLKILRKLAIYGFKNPTQCPMVAEFYGSLCEQVSVMLLFRKQHEGSTLKPAAEKYTNLLMKSMLELLENYPHCFLSYIRSVLEIVTTFAFTDDAGSVMYERFTVQCLNMIKCILDCPEYRVSKVIEETKSQDALEAHKIKAEFFTKTVLEQICHRLITQYFILSRSDLEIWDSDPEGFCTEVEGGDSWKFSLRPATECLFRKMFHDYKEAFSPVLLSLMSEAVKMTDMNNLQGILTKDAVYNAIGLTSFELFEEIDFDNLFSNHLVHELKITDSNYRILRRRIIWLVGQWSDVRFHPDHRPLLYEACIHLLTHDLDFVVRYHTAMTLRTTIDDFDFDRKAFLPYLPTVFSLLFGLLKEAKECDVKMQVLNVMSVMVEVVGPEVRECVAPLVQFLPQLWTESEEHNLLRCAILNTLTHVVAGMGPESSGLHEFLLLVLQVSTDTSAPCHVYLLEDGLQLWLCVIQNTPTTPSSACPALPGGESGEAAVLPDMYARLLDLYGNLLPVLDSSTEHLEASVHITIAYTMLCPRHFLQRYGGDLLDILAGQVSDLKPEALVLVLRLLEAAVRTCLRDAVLLVRPVVAQMANSLLSEGSSQYPMMVSMHLSLLARVLLIDHESFSWILEQLGKCFTDSTTSSSCSGNDGDDDEAVLTRLLRVWCARMCVVSPDERRKLAAMGLCRLLAECTPAVLAVWPRLVEAVVEVVYDVTSEETGQDKLVISESDYTTTSNNSAPNSDSSYLAAVVEDDDANVSSSYSSKYGDSLVLDPDCEHNKRRLALVRVDPAHTVSLRQCLGEALLQFQRQVPPEVLCHLMSNMGDDVKTVVQEVTAATGRN